MLLLAFLVLIAEAASHAAKLDVLILLSTIATLFFIVGLKIVLRKGPGLQFGIGGIWTPKLGDMKWQQVLLKFDRVSTGKSGTMYTLKILAQTTGQQLDWVALGTTDAETERIQAALKVIKSARFN